MVFKVKYNGKIKSSQKQPIIGPTFKQLSIKKLLNLPLFYRNTCFLWAMHYFFYKQSYVSFGENLHEYVKVWLRGDRKPEKI